MSRIIAVTNQKGGVGKTTTSINLAAALARTHKRVLLVDLDPQGNATMGSGINKNTLTVTLNEVLLEEAPPSEAIVKSENGYDMFPANSHLTTAEVQLIQQQGREFRLREALTALADRYEFILIDSPPTLNTLTVNGLVAANSVIIPMQCEYYALEGLTALLQTINQIRATANPLLEIEGLLRTMYDGRNRLAVDVSQQLLDHFGDTVFRTVIPRNVRLAEAPSHGLSAINYDEKSPGSLAYLTLAGEVLRRQRAKV